jgi:Xaa-Pro aminopeptidase
MQIGIAGLGRMGAAIAGRLIEVGHTLTVWNRSAEKARPLEAAGAALARSPGELVAKVGTVVTILTDAAAIETVYDGSSGLPSGKVAGKLFIEMSTVRPQTEIDLAGRVRAKGASLVECPVGGTVGPARQGKLIGLMGAEEDDAARARPILEQLCRRLEHVGPVGNGAVMKLAVNLPLLVYCAAGRADACLLRAGEPRQLGRPRCGEHAGLLDAEGRQVAFLAMRTFPVYAWRTAGAAIREGVWALAPDLATRRSPSPAARSRGLRPAENRFSRSPHHPVRPRTIAEKTMANAGIVGLDWQQRINWDRLRKYRLERARERLKAHGLGALLLMYDENVRYVTGTLTPGWNRLKPGLRYALLCGDGAPVLFEQGDIGFQIQRHSPWIPPENVRWSYAWIKGAAGPASTQQVRKFTNAIQEEMRRHGVAGQKLGVDFIDINMLQMFQDSNIHWTDGMTPMMEARAVKNEDEQEAMRVVGAIGDAAHWETMKFLRPGLTENQVTAHIMEFLYRIPGMEDVEDVIVSSGPNTWPNWRNFSDRIIKPGDIVFMDLAALTWNGYKSCYYRTYCVGKEPTQEQKDVYATALEWLYDSIDAVRAGTTTREIASKWPSAQEAWGYAEEDQAAANLWGHGLGLAQYDQPVISRIWSLDHPVEIKAGMVFALETQHGHRFRWGVRIEEMLIVHPDQVEIISNFPVKQITVVDPIPGYGDHVR